MISQIIPLNQGHSFEQSQSELVPLISHDLLYKLENLKDKIRTFCTTREQNRLQNTKRHISNYFMFDNNMTGTEWTGLNLTFLAHSFRGHAHTLAGYRFGR